MNSPETYDGFDAYDEDDLVFFEEDYSDDLELPSQDESLEETNDLKSGSRHQPSALSISCYGAPEEDTSVEFLDERFALEEEITLPSGETVRLQLTSEQRQRLEVIRSLAQARHNRQIFSQRLGEGAEKLGLSRRQVRRIFQDWVNEGLASLQKAPRLDKGKPRRNKYWYELSITIYKEGNKGTSSLTRTQAADKIRTQAYEYTKLELRSDILKLEENGLQGEDLDRELLKLIEQREEACKQSRQVIQEEITQLKKKISVQSNMDRNTNLDANGSPKYIYTDGGKDFKFLTYIGDQLGFEFELRQRPSQGGIVERPFRTMSELLSEVLGYTGPNVQERPKDVEKVVCMTLRELDKLVAGYICDTYNQKPDPRTRANPFAPTQSRIARWEGGLRMPPPVWNPRELDVCLMRTDERVVYDSGYIKFENLLYKGENLGQYAGDTVFLRFDPRDITMLLVYVRQNNREKFIARAYAVGLESQRLSLEEVKHSAKKCRNSGKLINNIAILEETLRRRKLLDSKKKKTKGERRHIEQMKIDPLPERHEEDQPKQISDRHEEEQPKQQIEVLPTSVEDYAEEPDDDESEDYGAEEYESVEQVNYNKLRQEFGL